MTHMSQVDIFWPYHEDFESQLAAPSGPESSRRLPAAAKRGQTRPRRCVRGGPGGTLGGLKKSRSYC